MKKSSIGVVGGIIIIVFVGVLWYKSTPSSTSTTPATTGTSAETNPSTPIASTATVKVSDGLSSYQNTELGFSLKYPTAWEKDETDAGPTFVMPIDTTQVSTVAKLQADIGIVSGKCAFPPVTTIT